MYFWESEGLSIKKLFMYGWKVFWKDALGLKIVILILLSSWFPLMGEIAYLVLFLFYCLLIPYIIYQSLIGKDDYFNLVIIFFKQYIGKYIGFLLVTLIVFGGLIYLIQSGIEQIIDMFIPTLSVSDYLILGVAPISVPFFFMAFSVSIKNMSIFKALACSFILVKRHWLVTIGFELIIMPFLLLPVFVPNLSLYVSELIGVFFLVVLIILYCNLDYIDSIKDS